MTDLEKADSRIQIICEKIRAETLDPAKEEAQTIIEHARKEAERILLQAHKDADEIKKSARRAAEEEKQIFNSSLQQSCKQTIDLLKQKIEQSLFNPALEQWVKEELNGPASHAKLIEVLVKAIEKEGIHAELAVMIPQSFPADTVNAKLSEEILKQLRHHSVNLSDISGGIQVKLEGKNMVLDLSLEALRELIRSYIHKDFRKVFFGLQ